MEYLDLSNFILMLLTGIIIYFIWFCFKIVGKQKKISVSIYVLLLGLAPLSSFFLMYIIITTSSLHFFGYIFVILFTCFVFVSVWILTAFNGEYKKVELSMYIVVGVVSLLFMMSMALIEILPNGILELYLKPLISNGSQYDIWSRPPYQLAHFITYILSFPYIASFVIGKGILNFRRYKEE
jgi:hypothetical protein